MARVTGGDPALVDFIAAFPAKDDGLVQLRMWFTGYNRPQHLTPYPAAVLKITGGTWTQLDPPKVDCGAGKATSIEQVALPSSKVSPSIGPTTTAGGASGKGNSRNGSRRNLACCR